MARRPRLRPLIALGAFEREAAATDRAAALAFFVQEHSGSVTGRVWCRMNASDQRTLFGRYIGKGALCIDGADETVSMYVTMCFGTMTDVKEFHRWSGLAAS